MLTGLIIAGFLAGFVDSIAGGGGLISLPALLALGMDPKTALGTNKLIGIANSSASSIRYISSGKVNFKKIFPIAISAGICSALGSFVATKTSVELLRPIILILLITVGIYTLTRRKFGKQKLEAPAYGNWLFPILASLLGFYDGFFGPGTGTFLMVACVLLKGHELLESAATSRLINFGTNLGAIILFWYAGFVDYKLAFPAAIASLIGGIVGSSFAIRKGTRLIRPIFIGVTWLLIAKIAWDFLGN